MEQFDIQIRPAECGDIDGILKLLHQVQNVHADGRPDLFKHGGAKYTAHELEDILSDNHKPIFVAVQQNQVLGYIFCAFQIQQGNTSLQPIWDFYIDDLCIDENLRHSGVGKMLYDYAKDFAVANHFDRITLHAWECNQNAVGFYEHLGLKPYYIAMEELL